MGGIRLTHCSDDLCLQTKLIREAASKVIDTTFAVTRNVGHLSDVIEHVSARKQENGDETYRGPQVPVLDHGKDVARGDTKEGYQA